MAMIRNPDLATAMVMFDGAIVWIRIESRVEYGNVDNTPSNPIYLYRARVEGVMPFGEASGIVITEGIYDCRTEEAAWGNGVMAVLDVLRKVEERTIRM